MLHRKACLYLLLAFSTAVGAAPRWDWVKVTDTSVYGDLGTGVAVAENGDIYFAGNFGLGGRIESYSSSYGSLFWATLDGEGNAKRVMFTAAPYGAEAYLGVTKDGGIFAHGIFYQAMSLGDPMTVGDFKSGGFVASFSSEWELRWRRTYRIGDYFAGSTPAIGSSGNILNADIYDSFSYDGITLPGAEFGGGALFLIKPDGAAMWAKAMSAHSIVPVAAATADDGSCFVGGQFAGTSMGFGNVTANNPGPQEAAWLAKTDSLGNAQWIRSFGTNYGNTVLAAAATTNGDVILGGILNNTPNAFVDPPQETNFVSLFERFTSAGNPVWSRRIRSLLVRDIKLDRNENIVILGNIKGTVEMDGQRFTPHGDADVFVGKFSPAGNLIWGKFGGSVYGDLTRQLAISPDGSIVICGTLQGVGQFDAIKTSTGNREYIPFVAKITDDVTNSASLPAGTLFIEGEDFNFNHGQYVSDQPVGMTGPYAGGAYRNKGDGLDAAGPCYGTDFGIDYNDGGYNEADAKYRPMTRVAAGKLNGPAGLDRGTFDVQVNHTIGWTSAGEWLNYTRDFPAPAQGYKVFARMAHGEAGARRGGILLKVTGDPTKCADTGQVTEELGRFSGPWTGGWDVWPESGTPADALLPMKDANGNIVTIILGGKTTLRFQFAENAGDLDYLAFIPAETPPVFELEPKSQSVEIGETLTLNVGVVGSEPITIRWLKDGVELPKPTGASLVIPNIAAGNAGDYRAEASNAFGVTQSAVARVTISPRLAVQVTTLAGTGGEGHLDSANPSVAQFSGPDGGGVTKDGVIFVGDAGNHVIRCILPSGEVWTWSGTAGVSGYHEGAGTNTVFNLPLGLAVDSVGDLLVADYGNHRVRKVLGLGYRTSSLLAGTGVAGFEREVRFGRSAALSGPNDLVELNGEIYFTEFFNHTVRRLDRQGYLSVVAGNGTAGYRDGAGTNAVFNGPAGITSYGGELYVTEWFNNRIRKVTTSGNVTTVAGSGVAGFKNGLGTSSELGTPNGIVADGEGHFYFTEMANHAVRRLDTNGWVTTLAGTGVAGFADGDRTQAKFNGPGGICMHPDGSLIVMDTYNHRVRRIVVDGQTNGWMRSEGFLTVDLHPTLKVFGNVGERYRIESRDRLGQGDWAAVESIVLEQSPTMWVDQRADGGAARMYRAVKE